MKLIIENLTNFGERQLQSQLLAAKFLETQLEKFSVAYRKLSFMTQVPEFINYGLFADDKEIECLPTGLQSGIIDQKAMIFDVLNYDDNVVEKLNANLNYSSLCPSISRHTFWNYPSLAFSMKDLDLLLNAKKIHGFLEVQPVDLATYSLLVGNTVNPKNILFSHFDSIEVGATDNASGTAVMLKLLLDHQELLRENLFVFDPNEEISYDFPIYWGFGYRAFEANFKDCLMNSNNIFIVDCVGQTPLNVVSDPEWLYNGFPIQDFANLQHKTQMLCGDFEGLMRVYQSPIDTLDQQKEAYLQQAYDYLLGKLS